MTTRLTVPYHDGELQVQEKAGEVEAGRRNGSVIAPSIVRGAIPFISQQPVVALGSVDDEGRVWASLLFGRTGFMRALDERRVEIDLEAAHVLERDPFWANIESHREIGMLFIELATRRRLRVNGRVVTSDRILAVNVDAAYPNCPKYIQRRHVTMGPSGGTRSGAEPAHGSVLRSGHVAWIESADTFFVASAHPQGGVDASHRGGVRGFVRVVQKNTLRIPDYPGNSMFNTLGNFTVYPQAGLIFLDFAAQRTLQLVGRPRIVWDGIEDPLQATGGTTRYWELTVHRWLETELGVGMSWEFLDASPHNPRSAG